MTASIYTAAFVLLGGLLLQAEAITVVTWSEILCGGASIGFSRDWVFLTSHFLMWLRWGSAWQAVATGMCTECHTCLPTFWLPPKHSCLAFSFFAEAHSQVPLDYSQPFLDCMIFQEVLTIPCQYDESLWSKYFRKSSWRLPISTVIISRVLRINVLCLVFRQRECAGDNRGWCTT